MSKPHVTDEMVLRAWDGWCDGEEHYTPCPLQPFCAICDIEKQKAELEALRADALRYRWLREECNIAYEPSEPIQLIVCNPGMEEANKWREEIDSAIDEARKGAA